MKKQSRVIAFALFFALSLLALTGCGYTTVPPEAGPSAHTLRDDEGRTVHVPYEPERVAVLFSSLADMWCLAGGNVAITVGESVDRGIVCEDAVLVDSGAGKSISVETLVAAAPDFVIGSADIAAHKALVPALTKAGIPFALFRVDTLGDYERVMKTMCAITRRADLYESEAEDVRDEANAILESVPALIEPPKILFVRVGSGYSATKAKRTEEHFVCAMLAELGAINLADGAPALSDGLNIEAILEMDPDYIFFSPMGNEENAKAYMNGLLATAPWQALTAVAEGNYTYLPKSLFQYKPCDEWAEAYVMLYGYLYEDFGTEK